MFVIFFLFILFRTLEYSFQSGIRRNPLWYIYIYIWIEGKHLMQEKENKKEIAVEIVASEDKWLLVLYLFVRIGAIELEAIAIILCLVCHSDEVTKRDTMLLIIISLIQLGNNQPLIEKKNILFYELEKSLHPPLKLKVKWCEQTQMFYEKKI